MSYCGGITCAMRQDHPKDSLVVVVVCNLRDLPSIWWFTTTKWILFMLFPLICMLNYGACDFYKALPIFLCSALMRVYDIPMSLLIFCYLIVLLFCCLHAPLSYFYFRLAVVVFKATYPISPH
jgi:hypothetical protein